MDRYPHTIDNGAGERLTFLGRGSDDRGEYVDVRNSVAPGSGPPMHVHHRQEESLTIEQGRMGWLLEGGEEQFAEAGETVSFAPGESHRFWNAGEVDLVCSGQVRPPDNLEYFLGQMFASTKAAGGTRPRIFDAAYLMRRYRSEFAMREIPQPVQGLLFPVIVAVGRLFGLDRRFEGAPEPIDR